MEHSRHVRPFNVIICIIVLVGVVVGAYSAATKTFDISVNIEPREEQEEVLHIPVDESIDLFAPTELPKK